MALAPTREREALAEKFGNKLFIPVLAIPVITALCAIAGPYVIIGGRPLLQKGSETVIGLAAAGIIAIVISMIVFRLRSPALALTEGRRLTEDLGWALVLPQLLSVLGLVFATAGVGTAIGSTVSAVLPKGSLLPAVILYCVGHGGLHRDHGQRVRRVPGAHRGDRLPGAGGGDGRQPGRRSSRSGCSRATAGRSARRWPRTSTSSPSRCWS